MSILIKAEIEIESVASYLEQFVLTIPNLSLPFIKQNWPWNQTFYFEHLLINICTS